MADEENKEGGGKSKMMLFAIIGVVVLVVAVGVAAYLLGSRSAQNGAPAEDAQVEDTAKAEGVGPMIDVTDFIINILDKNETRYLKAAITLELEDEATVAEVNERMPQIRDSVLLLVGNKTFAELNDLQGKLQLRAEIIVRLNKLLKKGKVKGIYFTEFVVQ